MRVFRIALTTSVLGTGLACLPVFQQPARAQGPATPISATASGPTAYLLNSANHWRTQGKPQYALKELNRILGYAPTNVEVLALAADIALDMNDSEAAARYFGQLSRVAPEDPRIAALAAVQRLTPEQSETLEVARRLSQSGKPVEAVETYKKLFETGAIPRHLAVEYYSTVSATPNGLDEASEGLGAIAEQFPTDTHLQLAYARLLVRDEGSRASGIRRLADLAADPGVGSGAQQAWRETLLWQGPSEKARSQLQAYLARYATDAELEAKRKEFDAILPDDGTKALLRGYNLMSTDLSGAKKEFVSALAFNPRNPDAMVMLAAIDRVQKQPEAAQELIDRAVAIAPDRRAELINSAGGENFPVPTAQYFGFEDAAAYATSQLAARAVKEKRFEDADALYAKAADAYARVQNRSGVQLVSVGRAALVKDRERQAALGRQARSDGHHGLATLAAQTDYGVPSRRYASNAP